MAAKLLYSLTDENPDLQTEMGYTNGIFQRFDRQNIVPGKRSVSEQIPQRHTSGGSHWYNDSYQPESNPTYHYPTAKEKNSNKNANEKQRISTETSRAITSSSRSSSFSSLDYRIAQLESLSFEPTMFPETPSRYPTASQSSSSPRIGRRSLDLRDVVKESMYRESRGLLVKTTDKEELSDSVVRKDKDSARLLQHSKSFGGVQNQPANLKESVRALAKLKESPWYVNEVGDRSRPSFESVDGSMFSAPKDSPRFSYDGRDLNLFSFESRDEFKSAPRLKELPRLSLDSRDGSMRSFNSDSKSSFLEKNSAKEGGNSKRPPNVIAKLMGLETLPNQSLDRDNKIGLLKTTPVESPDPFLSLSRVSNSPQSFWNGPASPRWKNPDSVMKPISSSRVPLEPAPWKQPERSRGSEKPASRSGKSPTRVSDSFTSVTVYSQIDKRLKDLEFNQSGKDLRALKQILQTMQSKGLLDTGRQDQDSIFATQTSPRVNAGTINQQKPHDHGVTNLTERGFTYLKNIELPIVIMKPAKLVEKHGIPASSVIAMDGLSGLSKLRGGDYAHGRKGSIISSHTPEEQVPQTSGRANGVNSTGNKKTSHRNSKSAQSSIQSQQLSKENGTSFVKTSGSASPRLGQKKLELEKWSRPPISPDSSKSRRQPNKQQPESSSPGAKRRPRSKNLRQNDDQLSDISNKSRYLTDQEDVISIGPDGNIGSDSGTDTEVAILEQCAETKAKHVIHGLVQNKLAPRLSEDGALAELAIVATENPSPVSVLDNPVYGDDALSPIKHISGSFKDGSTMNSTDCGRDPWNPEDNLTSNSSDFGFKSGIDRMKLQDIDNLVQKLRLVNSSHNEDNTDYIASLCQNSNPDHRYVSEILLASGLLLRDLNSGLTTFQLHPSGHRINPELFLVLEQTRSSSRRKEESNIENFAHSKPEKEKSHRKLIFDAVNEILVYKFPSVGGSAEPWLRSNKLAGKSLTAQKLLKELCSEIDSLVQGKKSGCGLEDGNDGLKSILCGDPMHGSESWTDFGGEISGMALDVERLIFRDLIGEIVNDEAARFKTNPDRHRKRLF